MIRNILLFPKFRCFSFLPLYNNSNMLSKTLGLIYKRMENLNEEFQQLSIDTVNGDMNELKRHRMNYLQPRIHIFKQIEASITIIRDAKSMINSGLSKEEIEFMQEEIQNQEKLLQEYQEEALTQLVSQDDYDDVRFVTVEIRPGVGGSESSLFAEDMMNMIQNYSNSKNWDCRVIQQQKDQQIGKGCKLAVLQITGQDVYTNLKCESGVHKVIRVPETESKGRLHSSTVSVIVLPKITDTFSINEKDLRIDYMRASGPGGQHVNKTESACRITHIPTGIQVLNMEDRSQDRNKQRAMQILTDKLFAIHVQEKQERMTQSRKNQVQGTDRSDKIRTYNYPQERITDHRTNITLFGIEKMMNGELLDEFIEGYQAKIYNAKLEDLLDDLEKQG